MNVLSIAYYTSIKYFRNVVTIIAFILVPLFMVLILTGSTEMKYFDNNKAITVTSSVEKSKAVQGIKNTSNLAVTIVTPTAEVMGKNNKVSIAVVILFLFYASLLTSYSIINDFKSNTHLRLKTSPTAFFENILGKSLGNIMVTATCAIILVFATKFAFNVSWGKNIFVTMIALLLFLIIINSFGILITTLSKNIFICALICFAFNFTMIFPVFVETYAPVKSDALQVISKFSLHRYAIEAIINGTSNSIIMLALITAFMFCLSLLAGRRLLK